MSWEEDIVFSDRIGRVVAAQLQLEKALEASKYASHSYSTHPRELNLLSNSPKKTMSLDFVESFNEKLTMSWSLWPPLIEVEDTWELPSVLIERYNTAAGEGIALCGIFPEIRRAWAFVDNALFLWRFDKWLDSVISFV
ncbi:hypothetical protein PTKIN_Ptkin17bG0120200 [Pterospermum kingtungense]